MVWFRVPTHPWYGSPGSTLGPSIRKLFAAFLKSSLSFTRYMLPLRRPTKYTYSLKVPYIYHTRIKYIYISHIYLNVSKHKCRQIG